MNNDEHQMTQDLLVMTAKNLSMLDLGGFLDNINNADSIGAIMDPTLYRDGMDNLHAMRNLAQKAQQMVGAFHELNEAALKTEKRMKATKAWRGGSL